MIGNKHFDGASLDSEGIYSKVWPNLTASVSYFLRVIYLQRKCNQSVYLDQTAKQHIHSPHCISSDVENITSNLKG